MRSQRQQQRVRPGVEALEDRLVPAPLDTVFSLLHTFNNPTPAAGDHIGWSVAVSGDRVLVGAPDDNTGAAAAGSAYLYDAVSGNLLHTLNNPNPAPNEIFGLSVAVSGDRVLVGAPGDNTGAAAAGSAYLYDAVTGSLLHTFNNPTPAGGDNFGYSVAVSGDRVLVGAPDDNTGAADAGSAYLYDAVTGNLLHTYPKPNPAVGDVFGLSVAVSGDWVVVGAPGNDFGAANAGAAYLFGAISGNLLHAFYNPTPAVSDEFGSSVAVSGNRVLVGAGGDNFGADRAGSAYLFDTLTGALLLTFHNPTPAAYDSFGSAVSMSADRVLVGALDDDTGVINAGAAYLFDAATGDLLRTIDNPTPAGGDLFGSAVAVSGDRVLVGAQLDDTGADDTGSAYLFGDAPELPPPSPVPIPAPARRGLSVALRRVKRGGRRVLTIQVRYADDGAPRAEFRCPFQPESARGIRAALVDLDGDGAPDAVRLTARRGGRRLARLVTL